MQHSLTRLLALLAVSSPVWSITVPQPNIVKQASTNNGGLDTEGVETLDGVPIDAIPEGRSAPAQNAMAMPAAVQAGFKATADSNQGDYPPNNAIDGNANTFWHSQWSNPVHNLPHFLQVDMGSTQLINSISYQPRQDGSSNGNIGGHRIDISTDGKNFRTMAFGTYRDDASTKTTQFEAVNARYVKLIALTEAGNRGPWSNCAEFKIFTTNTKAPAYQGVGGGEWSPTIDFPLVPVSVALEYNRGKAGGKLIAWSSYAASTFGGSSGKQTLTATYDPADMTVSQRTVTNTNHDMFCEGLSFDVNGRIFSTGGNSATRTSIFTPSSESWSPGPQFNRGRGYHSQVTLSDGRIFTIGGSWSGGEGGKNGEIYSSATNKWTTLSGCPVAPLLTADAQGTYRADNHAWLFAWKNNYVFQAGPCRHMNWYLMTGNGGTTPAGNRGGDGDAMCGNAVMYDAVAGKILTVGGATSYQGVDATANANIITIGTPPNKPTVEGFSGMYNKRIFGNAVVMPNGNVFIVGGQVHGAPFSDATSILQPEVWVANTRQFIRAASFSIPRNYHSVAILLADATIFIGGGGLCGSCSTNHYDGQIYRPGYLFNGDGTPATRPKLNSVNGGDTATVNAGGTLTVTTGGGITSWSIIRMGATTHTVNTDQRRVPLTATATGTTYKMTLPGDRGVVVPGPWLLFGMNAQGTPSDARYVLIH